jgi:ABC-type polysaccharide/polyol phosphate transport system ATPase subunit
VSNDYAIRLDAVGKRYVKYSDTPMLTTALWRAFTRTKRSALWAVRGMTIDVQRGECVGIIGRNGAGKSTTLQLLSGITAPTEGSVSIRGRVAPLISVGVGFHPELTGRENVYLNGTILGLRREQIDQRLEAIVDFAEIGAFLDTPVKFYSSGMFVRLGFAVATQAEPDILLVDEVLAVGDLAFQIKCFEHMEALRSRGTTVVVVSHNLNAVQRLCERVLVLDHGSVVFDGDVSEGISRLHQVLSSDEAADKDQGLLPRERGLIEVLDSSLVDSSGQPRSHASFAERLRYRVTIRAMADIVAPFLGVFVRSESGIPLYIDNNLLSPFPALSAGETVTWTVEMPCSLARGSYSISGVVGRGAATATTEMDRAKDVAELATVPGTLFFVEGRGMVEGYLDLHAQFGQVHREALLEKTEDPLPR